MSGASLVSDFSGLHRVQAVLHRLADAVEDLTPMFDDIGAALVVSSRARFEAQAGPDGRRWAPHSADTVLSRLGGVGKAYTKKMNFRAAAKRRMSKMQILILRGHLHDSLTWRATRTSIEIGTPLVYGAIHQFGGEAGRTGARVKIPARPYLGLSGADEDMILGAVQAHLREVLQ